MIKVDVVGGGLSGFSTAISLKRHCRNINVVVHEKHKRIGYNHEGRRCGEAHSVEGEWKKWKPQGKSVFNEIRVVETVVGDKKYVMYRKPGTSCILNRQEFICQLAREAERLGVEIWTGDKIHSLEDLQGEYIVDATGCPSTIKRELHLLHGITGMTYQQTLEESNYFISDTVKIIFMETPGYYWIFPRDPDRREINLGVGIIGKTSDNLKGMLEAFKKQHDIRGKINYVTGGLIPAGLQKPLKYDNVLFVGDAGVGTFPLTGQGIYRALISGEIAGKAIALGFPEKYPFLIKKMFIKWDILGKSFVYMNQVLKEVSGKMVLTVLQCLLNLQYKKIL
ncbi:MAG: hypothetical protein DRN05_03210 [Thermoplasmata archaeon]|nr:MAG: hypothetical protein DRN05_03210 [Thermoplasmata archaeon]